MKVIVAGSRHIKNYGEVVKAILDSGFEVTEVVSGGAMGVDTMGERWARENRIPVTVFEPDWEEYGKSAGPIRNEEMALYAEALIIVWDGKSKGSADMRKKAHSFGLKVYQHVV